jgi:hypothetical protein
MTPGSGVGDRVLTGRRSRVFALKGAIESTSKIKVEVMDPDKEMELMFLGVGINSAQ